MLVHAYYPADVRVRREAHALRDAGCQVDVVCLRQSGEAPREMVDGITVIRLPVGRRRGSRIRYLLEYAAFVALATWRLWRLARRTPYALAQVHTLPDFLVFAAWPMRRRGAKILLDLHEIAPEFYQQKYEVGDRAFPVRALRAVEQASIRFADRAITVSEPLRERFVERGASAQHMGVVMNSADERLFPAGAALAPDAPSRDRFALVYHGTLLPIYGLDITIDALAMVRERYPFSLHLFGAGEGVDRLREVARRQGVSERVHFHGLRTQEELAPALLSRGAGVVPTRPGPMLDLSLSNKLLEFVCLGMPVLAADLPSYLRHFPAGSLLYFRAGDPRALADALAAFAELSDDDRTALAGRGWQAYQPWRWPRQRDSYLRLVEQLGAR